MFPPPPPAYPAPAFFGGHPQSSAPDFSVLPDWLRHPAAGPAPAPSFPPQQPPSQGLQTGPPAPPGQWFGGPPGRWVAGDGGQRVDAHVFHDERTRGRSRDRRRRGGADAVPDARTLAASMGKNAFADFVSSCLSQVDTEEFARIWPQVPRDVRSVVWRAPPDVTVDVEQLPEPERAPMRVRLNELRRERCKMLSGPKQQYQWDEQAWVFTPMSRVTSQRFWQLFRIIPLADADPSKWARTIAFLKDSPVKGSSFKSDLTHSIDQSARLHSRSRSPPRDRPQHQSMQSAGSGRDSLRALAIGSPESKRAPPDSNSAQFHDWVHERVQVDIANFNLASWEVSKDRRYQKKVKPVDALGGMCSLTLMNDVYQSTVQIYVRKLEKAIKGLHANSKEAKALTALCISLNIDGGVKDGNIIPLLARLRALDMVQAPP